MTVGESSKGDLLHEQKKTALEKSGWISTTETRTIAGTTIDKHFQDLRRLKSLPGFGKGFAARLPQKYSALRESREKDLFQNVPQAQADRAKIRTMTGWLIVRDSFRLRGTPGVVVAGFGEADIYPRLQEFTMGGIIENKRRYRSHRHLRIGIDTMARGVRGAGFPWR